MSENAPPPGTAGTAQGEARGTPYFEKLRRDLRDALQKKRILDDQMARLDQDILFHETRYLEETTAGNIIKGFDNYIKGATGTGGGGGATGGTSTRRRTGISDSDRIFSRSSVSVARSQDSPAPSSANTTPSHAPTPTSNGPPNGRASNHPTPGSTGANKSTSKKKKAGDDEDDTDTKSVKRTKISYGRD
ncbi:NuA4-domain-containing protein [Rhizodiscina lignyota]|uniref:Chromatin modification-related protein EAF6 n=1 Tax=Rhizodiscina lignyota TaxID=1504668 RepID=A0A9P4M631_9PEZI|nr:NuA4-domain-containing protein [Rhizodiscina lignyota]